MNSTRHNQDGPTASSPRHGKELDDWEEWEDDEPITPIDAAVQVHIQQPELIQIHSTPSSNSVKTFSSRVSRQSTQKIKRLKSRQRQKAQNAKFGIKLVTDMATLRRNNHIANQLRPSETQNGKFVDAAALRALEGEPNSASVGNWNWLKRNRMQSPASANTPQSTTSALSPEDRPIVIGLSMSAIDSSADAAHYHAHAAETNDQSEPKRSVWSPDTPSTANSFSPGTRPASSIYSQMTGRSNGAGGEVPPVPVVPAGYRNGSEVKDVDPRLDIPGEDESTSPHTLFEEDGIPSPQPLAKGKLSALTPDSAASKSHGWWDHVVTPFTEKRMTFTTRKQKPEQAHNHLRTSIAKLSAISDPEPSPSLLPQPLKISAPIIRAPTPKRSLTPPLKEKMQGNPFLNTESSTSCNEPNIRSIQEKPQSATTQDSPPDQPPPYSPLKRQQGGAPLKYRAVFPPGHPLYPQFPPSPGPQSPGLAATMTSQGATPLTDIHAFPTALPNRPVGSQLPQEHVHDVPRSFGRVERERRRHEKEEVVARKVGGFWRGRGCIPENGCFGRTGAEGRKRRRVYLGIAAAVVALLILIITLAVVLTRPQRATDQPSIWVNLTDFPPMPTGVLTVVGPDNTVAKNGCTQPSTLWSCSLPKDSQDSVAPYDPNQPTIVMEIQWDNSTRRSWRATEEEPPKRVPRLARGLASRASNLFRGKRDVTGFKPRPSPPDFKEMFFLGETTDNITSKEKGGEATPFFISLPTSLNDTSDAIHLSRRQKNDDNDHDDDDGKSDGKSDGKDDDRLFKGIEDAIMPPELDEDGTPVAARLLPNSKQQPVRLYDRGQPTEHYGFYTYFRRTIFLKSVDHLNDTTDGDIPVDEDGGCRKTEAAFLTTWQETRLLVQIWTKTLDRNTSRLLDNDGSDLGVGGAKELVRPGTMPYPVTVTLDTHGGDPKRKLVFEWPMNDRQQLNLDGFKALANNIAFDGKVVNPRSSKLDDPGASEFGGFDGGSGGCKCEWVNWE